MINIQRRKFTLTGVAFYMFTISAPGPDHKKQNSGIKVDSTLELTNQISHVTNFSLSNGIFQYRVNVYPRIFFRVSGLVANFYAKKFWHCKKGHKIWRACENKIFLFYTYAP